MTREHLDEEAIFSVARKIESTEDRDRYLNHVCGDDRGLRLQVGRLLSLYEEEQSFLESLPPGVVPSVVMPAITERVGTQIGPYKLLEQIGEGGMGVVYMAEQSDPIRRKVALKIIKPGMDTSEVVGRFEAERQALALMDHPNIAKVHDAGSTESGRPYFVMELVKGIPINQFCDQHKLNTRRRLALFVTVCGAIQHAHQKGVIHRDVKPSNVMVELHDVTAVPKVIDFGVAKATNRRLAERTLFTKYAQMIGTPLYMSPEQAQLSGLDVDTRSDVYSLGVLLYEIVTGATPFDEQAMREAGYDEMRRIIREDEPPKPSDRISTLDAKVLTTVSEQHGSDPRKFHQVVRGELDWIVMKALEKDRNRRYESASALAADVQRYLDDEPVAACPPSLAYCFSKFARRNKAALTTTALIAASLVMGTCISTWQAFEANKARRVADDQRKIADQETALAVSNLRLALQAVNDMYVEVATQWLAADTTLTATQQALLERALDVYGQIVRQRGKSEPSRHVTSTIYARMATLHYRMNQYDQAREALENAIAIQEDLVDQVPSKWEYRGELEDSYNNLAVVLKDIGLFDQALDALDRARQHAVILANQSSDDLEYRRNLAFNDLNRAVALRLSGRLVEAEQVARLARDGFSELDSTRLDISLNEVRCGVCLSLVLIDQGCLDDALDVLREAQRRCLHLRINFPDHRDVARVETAITEQVGQIHYVAGRLEEAADHFRKTLELRVSTLKARMKPVQWSLAIFKGELLDDEYEEPGLFCDYINTQLRLSPVLRDLGKVHEAELLLGEAVKASQTLADSHSGVLRYMAMRANSCAELAALLEDRRPEEAARARAMAAAIWREAIERCSHAFDFRSGLHGHQDDLEWFLETHPEQSVDEAPSVETARLSGDSVFHNHTTGVLFFEGEMWESAISHLEASAELRTVGQAYDWLYLAMAHWRLAQQDEARQWYDKAVDSMAADTVEDQELNELRDRAAELLGVETQVQQAN